MTRYNPAPQFATAAEYRAATGITITEMTTYCGRWLRHERCNARCRCIENASNYDHARRALTPSGRRALLTAEYDNSDVAIRRTIAAARLAGLRCDVLPVSYHTPGTIAYAFTLPDFERTPFLNDPFHRRLAAELAEILEVRFEACVARERARLAR